jgi:uncharacterized protein
MPSFRLGNYMTFTLKTAQELMRDNMLVKHYAGSHAYGTNIASSDVDFRGIFIADPVNIRTPFYPIKEVDDSSEEDTKFYELFQFMKLTLDCNPNVVETLWIAEQDIVHSTPAYDMLREAAPKLLSSKIAFTTSGYALSQLKRIKGHNKWINQGDKGVQKLKALYKDGSIDIAWLESNFPESVIQQVSA